MYNKEIKLKGTLCNGYYYFIDYSHPLATGNSGRVLYHRHLMSIKLSRWISDEEVVYHIDETKLNNYINNLQLLTRQEHSIIHAKPLKLSIKVCLVCGETYKPHRYSQKYCSIKCRGSSYIENNTLTKEVLNELIPKTTWKELGSLFGYSDVGIRKRAIALGCNVPKRKSRIT